MLVVPKVWGEEWHVDNGPLYCGKRMVLRPGAACSFHFHRLKTETFFVESGGLTLEAGTTDDPADAETIRMSPGDSYRIEPGVRHRFTGGKGGAVFFEFSTQDFPDDSYRLVPSTPGREFRACGCCGGSGRGWQTGWACPACCGSGLSGT